MLLRRGPRRSHAAALTMGHVEQRDAPDCSRENRRNPCRFFRTRIVPSHPARHFCSFLNQRCFWRRLRAFLTPRAGEPRSR